MTTIKTAESKLTKAGFTQTSSDKTSQTWQNGSHTIALLLTDSMGQVGPDVQPTVVGGVLLNGYADRNLTAAIASVARWLAEAVQAAA